MYGYGPVAISNILGLVAGYVMASGQTPAQLAFVQTVGVLLLFMGLVFTLTRKNPIIGPMGGLLTGLGLGLTLFANVHSPGSTSV